MSKLNEEVAVEVMGWEKVSSSSGIQWWMTGQLYHCDTDSWKPDQDRNQSRMVMNKAAEIIEEIIKPNYEYDDSIDVFSLAQGHIDSHIRKHYPNDYWVTPEQECDAALMAVREARK